MGQNPGSSVCADTGAVSTISCSTSLPFCAPGYACLSDNLCYQWCRVELFDYDCPIGYTCRGLEDNSGNEGLYVGTTEVGVCAD